MSCHLVLALLAAALVAAASATAGGGGATGLSATAECIEGRPVVHMRWTPSGAGRQRIQVTVLANGFRTGDLERSRRFSSTRARLKWLRARGEAKHYWRVMTRVGDRHVPSETATFDGPGCVGADQQP